jgi:hypothetical protein
MNPAAGPPTSTLPDRRPTWYAGPPTFWGEFWTMLHLPYTLMVLSFVLVGAAISPHISWIVLIGTLVAYFLGLGIGAHFLDQLPGMGSSYVRHWPSWGLWLGGAGGIGVAIALGVAGSLWYVGWPILILVLIQALCAFGYPLAPVFRGLLHRESVFALSWGSLPFLTSFYAQSGTITIVAVLVAAVFAAVAVIEIRLSRLSRRLRSGGVAASRDERGRPDPPWVSIRRVDLALGALAFGTFLLALALLMGRILIASS